jgi:hypothetical protein
MENTIIWRQIQKFNHSLKWHNLIGIALLLAISSLQYRYLRNCLLGPQKIDAEQLLKIKDIEQIDRDFVTFTSSKAMDTGFREFSVSNRSNTKTTTGKYGLAFVSNRKALLIETHPDNDFKNPTFTGGLSAISTNIQTNIVDPLVKEAPILKERILPFALSTDDYRSGSYILVPLLLGGLGICGWNIYRAKIRADNPRKHPVYNDLARYGDADSLANSIDREIRNQYNLDLLKVNTFYLTPAWLLFPSTYKLQITKLDQLMWVYKKVTSHSVNFIPTGKSYEIAIHDRFGQERTIKLSEQLVNETILEIARYAPWAIIGFDPEFKTMWDGQRDDFYAIVEQRKKDYRNN